MHTDDTFFWKVRPLWSAWQVNSFWLSHSFSVMVSLLMTLKVVGPEPLGSASTALVDTRLGCTGSPLCNQDMTMVRGLKPEA